VWQKKQVLELTWTRLNGFECTLCTKTTKKNTEVEMKGRDARFRNKLSYNLFEQ